MDSNILYSLTPEQVKVIVSCKDLPFLDAGITLWDCPENDCQGVEKALPGELGQFVAYIYDSTGKAVTIDDTSVPTLTDETIHIGQLEAQYGSSFPNGIKHIAGLNMKACNLEHVGVTGYACPQPQVIAAFVDGCFDCGDTITFEFDMHDNRLQSFNGGQERPKDPLVATVGAKCCDDCEDCPGRASCQPMMAEAVDKLNGNRSTGGYPGIPATCPPGSLDKPYKFMVAHSNWFVYCLTPEPEECNCEKCQDLPPITSVTINDKPVKLENTTNAAGDKTFLGHLDNVVTQINCAFDKELGRHNGTAFVTNGTDDCCARQLHVITCDASFAIEGLEVCDQLDPFKPFETTESPNYRDCKTGDCVEAETYSKTPCCGIIAILDQDKIECECECGAGAPPPDTLLRHGTLRIYKGDPFSCKVITNSVELLCAKLPLNSGGFIKWEASNQDADGEWWNNDSHREGYYGDLHRDKNGRFRNAHGCAKCNGKYCRYEFWNSKDTIARDSKTVQKCFYKTVWAIEKDHPQAKESLEKLFNALALKSTSGCKVPKVGSCDKAIEDAEAGCCKEGEEEGKADEGNVAEEVPAE